MGLRRRWRIVRSAGRSTVVILNRRMVREEAKEEGTGAGLLAGLLTGLLWVGHSL